MIEIKSEVLDELVKQDSKRGLFHRKACHALTPKKLRSHVRERVQTLADLSGAKRAHAPTALASLASQLCLFCCSDVLDAGVSSQRDTLSGLKLLPLASGELVELGKQG